MLPVAGSKIADNRFPSLAPCLNPSSATSCPAFPRQRDCCPRAEEKLPQTAMETSKVRISPKIPTAEIPIRRATTAREKNGRWATKTYKPSNCSQYSSSGNMGISINAAIRSRQSADLIQSRFTVLHISGITSSDQMDGVSVRNRADGIFIHGNQHRKNTVLYRHIHYQHPIPL